MDLGNRKVMLVCDSLFIVCALVMIALVMFAGCALTDTEKAALTTKATSVVEEILRKVPGGGMINDVTSIAGILWAALFTKRKVGKKLQEMKDSGKGEFFAKNKEA
jgi:hypothetical protein